MSRFGAWAAAIALAMSALASSVAATDEADRVQGRAQVMSPDVIVVGPRLIQLFGVDAPEERQPCFDAKNEPWNCAVAAAKTLLDLVGDFEVTCVPRAADRGPRMFAVCTVNGKDINQAMVTAGMALAVRDETDAYVPAENEAKSAKRGLWQGNFMRPWDYRMTPAGLRQPKR